MIKQIVTMVVLALSAVAPASAQEPPAQGSAAQGSMTQASRPPDNLNFEQELKRLLDSTRSSSAPVPKRDGAPGVRSGTAAGRPTPAEADATTRITDILRRQLLEHKCWVQPAEAPPDGERFDVVIDVRFNRNGRFSEGPVLMTPQAMPADNPPLQAFIQRAFDALKTCEAIGFRVPAQYFEDSRWIQMRFLSGF